MRQMRLAGSLALVVTGLLLMPDPLLAQGQRISLDSVDDVKSINVKVEPTSFKGHSA
jgi:hypothetical protein